MIAASERAGARPALIVLAAGASSRLGSCKALARIGELTVLERLLALSAACDGTPLVISGAEHEALRDALDDEVELARNPTWRLGRTSGVQLARRLRPGRDLLIAPVDVPAVPLEVADRLVATWLEQGAPARGFLAPRHVALGCAPRHGHPVIVGRALALELEAFSQDRPLRALRARARPALSMPTARGEVLDDLDTPEDLERLQARNAPPRA